MIAILITIIVLVWNGLIPVERTSTLKPKQSLSGENHEIDISVCCFLDDCVHVFCHRS